MASPRPAAPPPNACASGSAKRLHASRPSSGGRTPWEVRYSAATQAGFEGTQRDYIGAYKYAKAVLAQMGDAAMRVWPTSVGSFCVSPTVGPTNGKATVLDGFNITSYGVQPRNSSSSPFPAAVLSSSSSSSSSSSEPWLRAMQASIERELQRIPPTPLYDGRLREEADRDAEMRARRKKASKPVGMPPPLPADAKQVIAAALQRGNDKVLIEKFNIGFRRHDLNTLVSPHWLNDEVLNFYMQLLLERSENSRGTLPSLHVFTTFFYPKLRDRGYDMARSSTRRANPPVLQRDLILFPIHLGMHWCMAAIDMRARTLSYYDSLHGTNKECLSVLRDWLARESVDKLGRELDCAGWSEAYPKDIPAQQNGYDCGVFALAYAEHLSRDMPFSFTQKDMAYWRDRISYEVITGRLLDPQ